MMPPGPPRTILPHEVILETQVRLHHAVHFADAANGDDLELVKLPLVQLFMYMVSKLASLLNMQPSCQ